MEKSTALLFRIWLTLMLVCVLVFAYVAAGLLNNIRLLQSYEPPTHQAEDLLRYVEQERQWQIDTLEQRVVELEDVLSRAEIFEITFYTTACGDGDGVTATGTIPTRGRTVAVDPRRIKLGSRVWVEGLGVFVAEDTGGVVDGNIIDVYIGGDRAEALRLGRQLRKVVVL